MKRLYYIAEDIETTHHVSETLRSETISNWNLHVVARDEAGLAAYNIHSATIYEQLDIVHLGGRWALLGAGAGLLLALVVLVLEPFGWRPALSDAALMVVVGAGFGAWQGGMAGLSKENYKLAPFHDAIAAGQYLIMVDVRPEQVARVEQMLGPWFPGLRQAGVGSSIINPLESGSQVHIQNTH